ncbi:MAG: transposase [Prevotellaceae bacterium]|jgi:transposase|nr:transposase [Prevotellaceae bacterium]
MEEVKPAQCSECERMKEQIASLSAVVKRQEEEELSLLKSGRSSRTSSTPPSHDIGRSNGNSLRSKSGKKSGGQCGHQGHTLPISDHPDEIIEHAAGYCRNCGQDLHDIEVHSRTVRQEVEIPPVYPRYIERQNLTGLCPCCRLENKGDFPPDVKAPIQYGSSVQSIIGYLSVFQHLPYNRIKTLLRDMFHLNLSEGSIDNILESMSRKPDWIYREIQILMKNQTVVGSDETGCRSGGKKHWFHVCQNKLHTFIVSNASRGYKVMEEYFPDGFPHSVYVSDCLPSQLKAPAKRHRLCIAHLLRELLNFEKSLKSQWSAGMKDLFHRALDLKRILKITGMFLPKSWPLKQNWMSCWPWTVPLFIAGSGHWFTG